MGAAADALFGGEAHAEQHRGVRDDDSERAGQAERRHSDGAVNGVHPTSPPSPYRKKRVRSSDDLYCLARERDRGVEDGMKERDVECGVEGAAGLGSPSTPVTRVRSLGSPSSSVDRRRRRSRELPEPRAPPCHSSGFKAPMLLLLQQLRVPEDSVPDELRDAWYEGIESSAHPRSPPPRPPPPPTHPPNRPRTHFLPSSPSPTPHRTRDAPPPQVPRGAGGNPVWPRVRGKRGRDDVATCWGAAAPTGTRLRA